MAIRLAREQRGDLKRQRIAWTPTGIGDMETCISKHESVGASKLDAVSDGRTGPRLTAILCNSEASPGTQLVAARQLESVNTE